VPAFPFVEPFAAKDAERAWLRAALYLSAGLYALHPMHRTGHSLASGISLSMSRRGSSSIERRFIGLLDSDREGVGQHLRQAISVLAADGIAIDHGQLLDDLRIWLAPRVSDQMDRVRQRWARDFYRSEAPDPSADAGAEESLVEPSPPNE
jgi:CRISPR system Cascade subunit CasB